MINKPPPLSRDYNRDPKKGVIWGGLYRGYRDYNRDPHIEALKRKV